MSLHDSIYYAFVTGEVAPAFWGRSDLSKYDLGASLLENYFVDFRGGLLSRQGSEFTGEIEPNTGFKLARFRGTVADFLLVFTENKLRFVQNSVFLTEDAQLIGSFDDPVITSLTIIGHGYSTGDMLIAKALTGMVELHNRQFLAVVLDANRLQLTSVTGVVLDVSGYAAEDGSATLERVYTVTLPYAKEDLYALDVQQRYNELRFSHIDYPRATLAFTAATNWAYTILEPNVAITPPTGLSGSASSAGDAGTSFALTSINSDGNESTISEYHLALDIINYTTLEGSFTLNWSPVAGAVSYNVYRGLVLPEGDNVVRGTNLYYLGSAVGTEFTDNNIVPDYTKTPPVDYDPFAFDAAIVISIDAAGSAYNRGVGMFLAGPGTGFRGYPVVNTTGQIGGVKIIASGSGYTSADSFVQLEEVPTVYAELTPTMTGAAVTGMAVASGGAGYVQGDTLKAAHGGAYEGTLNVTAGVITSVSHVTNGVVNSNFRLYVVPRAGTGADFSVTYRGTLGETYPSQFRIFQQRGMYLASTAEPASLWASRPGFLDNYDTSEIVTAADGYSFTLDSVAVEPIKHALGIRNGMLLFTDDGIVQLKAETGKAVSAVNALSEPQVYSDVSDTPPIAVNLDVLFLTGNGESLNSLLYTEYTESFRMQDLSILASHLFGSGKEVVRMSHNPSPHKLIYMPRADGSMLTLTHEREQEVDGWAQMRTMGNYKDTQEIKENSRTVVYQLVERYLQGHWAMCVERIPDRTVDHAENYWGVDAGLSLPLNYPAAEVSADGITGDVNLTATGAVFSASNVGDIVYYAGGKLIVTAYTSTTVVAAEFLRDASIYIDYGPAPIPQKAASGDWSMTTPVSVISGLWHLEGQTVSIAYDGNAELDYVVANGSITLPYACTKVYIGLPYACVGASLPLVIPNKVAEGYRNKIFGAVPRLESTRGMEFGSSYDDLEELEDRTDEDWGVSLALRTDVVTVRIDSTYTHNALIMWRQRYPLPAALLGFVLKSDVGE